MDSKMGRVKKVTIYYNICIPDPKKVEETIYFMEKKVKVLTKYFILLLLTTLCVACSSTKPVNNPVTRRTTDISPTNNTNIAITQNSPKPAISDELDQTIREVSTYLNEKIPRRSKIVILNIESTSDALSNYIIEELIANAVNDNNFTVVDRKQLDDIQAELNFQLSGEVADNQAVAIGQKFGAQTIVSGRVSPIGESFRFSVRALSVESATIQAQFNKTIPTGPTIASLIREPNARRTTSTSNNYSPRPSTTPTTPPVPPPVNISSLPASEQPLHALVGEYKGSYTANQGEIGLTLTIYNEGGNYKATFEFYNLPGKSNADNGKFYMNVTYNAPEKKYTLKGYQWVNRPLNYGYVDLEGTLAGNMFSGKAISGWSNYNFVVLRSK